MRRFLIIIKLAAKNLLVSKMRTLLTILGIVIGIAAVMIVMSIGSSAQSLILDQVRNVGSNLVIILPGASEETGPPALAYGIVTTTLTNDDLKTLQNRAQVPHLAEVSGYAQGNESMRYEEQNFRTTFQGVNASFLAVEEVGVAKGRFLSPEEDASLSRVAVLGSTRATDLFGEADPIGKTVKLGDLNFRVVGVMKERGSVAFGSPDTTVYIPLLTAQKLLLGVDYLSFIRAKVDDEKNIEATKEDIRLLLRDRHNIEGEKTEDFSVRSSDSALGILQSVTDILKYFLVGVAGVSLFVGGIGIMNILLISFKQRIREIGLRKSLGALSRDIVAQFLIESIFISFVGTVIGVAFGIFITWIAAMIIQNLGYTWPFILSFQSVFVAFLISVAVGIIFGVYPARKASEVSPTEALRYE